MSNSSLVLVAHVCGMHISRLTCIASLLTTRGVCICVCVYLPSLLPSLRRLNPFLLRTLGETRMLQMRDNICKHTHTHFLSGVADQYTSSCSAYSPVISTCWYLIWGTHTGCWLIGLNVPFSACSQNGVKWLHTGRQLHTSFKPALYFYLP